MGTWPARVQLEWHRKRRGAYCVYFQHLVEGKACWADARPPENQGPTRVSVHYLCSLTYAVNLDICSQLKWYPSDIWSCRSLKTWSSDILKFSWCYKADFSRCVEVVKPDTLVESTTIQLDSVSDTSFPFPGPPSLTFTYPVAPVWHSAF